MLSKTVNKTQQYVLAALLTATLGACSDGNNDNDSMMSAPNIPAPNMAPTISEVPDQNITANGPSGAIEFSVADDTTPADMLVVSAISDNPNLVPDIGLVITGSGGDRSLVVTAQPDQLGSATISLTVTDAEQEVAERSFLLIVGAEITSFSNFTRTVFGTDANATPFQINALEFTDDSADFDDLLL